MSHYSDYHISARFSSECHTAWLADVDTAWFKSDTDVDWFLDEFKEDIVCYIKNKDKESLIKLCQDWAILPPDEPHPWRYAFNVFFSERSAQAYFVVQNLDIEQRLGTMTLTLVNYKIDE